MWIKNSIVVLVIFISMASSAATKMTESINPYASKISLSQGVSAVLSFDGGHASVIIDHNKTSARQKLINNYYSIPDYARDIWVGDFNFDGFEDIAITSHVNRSTNEPAYALFTWEQSLNQLIPILFDRPIYNFEYQIKDKLIKSSYQHYQFWTEDSYRFVRKQAYLFQRTQLIISNLWHTVQYTPQGYVFQRGISIDGELSHNQAIIKRSIISTLASIYTRPSPNAHIAYTLTRGDEVSMIDFKQDANHFNWVRVEFKVNKQVVSGWLLLSNLVDDDH